MPDELTDDRLREDELRREVCDLRRAAEKTRCQFLQAELDACMTALELVNLALIRGNPAIAGKGIVFVERVFRVIDRFLPGVPVAQRSSFEVAVLRLKTKLKPLRKSLPSPERAMSKTA